MTASPGKTILQCSSLLRWLAKAWYRRTGSLALFSPPRGAVLDSASMRPDFSNKLWTKIDSWDEPVSMAAYLHIAWDHAHDFAGKRVALLAHRDPEGIVDPYVIHYANHLRDCGFLVVLSSSAPIAARHDTGVFAAAVHHTSQGYHFASLKGALEAFPSLWNAEELFLTNDDIFAPLGDLQPIFDGMRILPCDSWGITQTWHPKRKSFYWDSSGIMLRQNALRHPALHEFFARIQPDPRRNFILLHEIRLMQWLAEHGLVLGAWMPAQALPHPSMDILRYAWKQALQLGIPLTKREIFAKFAQPQKQLQKKSPNAAAYPAHLLTDYFARWTASAATADDAQNITPLRRSIQRAFRKSPMLRRWARRLYRRTSSTLFWGKTRAVVASCAVDNAALPTNSLWWPESGWGEPSPASGAVHAVSGHDKNFTSCRIALIAHWDKDGLIDPYVRHYAAHLRECGFLPVLASGSPLAPLDENKDEFAAVLWREYSGYDFSSWKAAFHLFPSLHDAEQVFLTNDSIFAPFGSFKPIFAAMEQTPYDFWGMVESNEFAPHLQSYALLLRQTTLRHDAFHEFLMRIPDSPERDIALNHELRFASWLRKHGLNAGAWLPASSMPWGGFNPLHQAWKQLICAGVPILKRDMFTGREGVPYPHGWHKLARKFGYPEALINEYIMHLKGDRL